MKVKNTSKRVIKLMNGKDKVTLVPGTDDVYDVTDCADVQFYLDAGDLSENVGRRKSKPEGDGDKPMTVAQIKEALAEKGVEVPEGVTKRDDLKALLEAAGDDDEDE